jgi:hypothetical protein
MLDAVVADIVDYVKDLATWPEMPIIGDAG